jgi:hypothetical protein
LSIIERDSNSNTPDIDREIGKLKAIKTLKLPDNTLYCYLKLVAEKTNTKESADYGVDFQFVKKIITRVDINFKSEYDDTALHEVNHSAILKLIIGAS